MHDKPSLCPKSLAKIQRPFQWLLSWAHQAPRQSFLICRMIWMRAPACMPLDHLLSYNLQNGLQEKSKEGAGPILFFILISWCIYIGRWRLYFGMEFLFRPWWNEIVGWMRWEYFFWMIMNYKNRKIKKKDTWTHYKGVGNNIFGACWNETTTMQPDRDSNKDFLDMLG